MLPLCTAAELEQELADLDRDLEASPVKAAVDPERALELREIRLRWRAGVAADLAALKVTA